MPEASRGPNYTYFIASEISHFEQTLITLRASLPPFGPHKFAQAVDLLIKCIREALTVESEQLRLLNPEIAESEAAEKAKKYMSILRRMHSNLLPYLESVDTSFIPPELQAALLEILNKDQKELALFFYPTWEQNYEFYGYLDLARQYLDELGVDLSQSHNVIAELDRLPKWFIFIAYPRMESRNALLHTLMIHEAAHLMEHEAAISTNLMETVRLDLNSLNKVVDTFLTGEIPSTAQETADARAMPMQLRLKDFFPEDVMRSVISAECYRILRNWLEELACDLIATRIAGPAYLFALKEFTMLAGVTHFTDTHPAPHMRLRLIWDELVQEDMNYLGAQDSRIKKLIEDSTPSELESEPVSPFHRVAYDSIRVGLQQVQHKVRTVVAGEAAYKVGRFENEVLHIFEHLAKGEALSDAWKEETQLGKRYFVNTPVTFVSLLNAAWLVKLLQMEQFCKEVGAETIDQRVVALDNLNELVLKAIEGSSTLRKWQAQEQQKGVT